MSSEIIFLKGIAIDDFRDIEDEFTDRLLENIQTQDNYKDASMSYDLIRPIFESINTWTKTVNIRCWTCDFTFNVMPIFIPLTIKEIDENWCISVLGNFCTFNCACRYILDYLNNDLLENLLKLYEIFYNKKIYKIEPSLRRHVMKKYGGYMSEESYITTIKKISLKNCQADNIKREYVHDQEYTSDSSPGETLWTVN